MSGKSKAAPQPELALTLANPRQALGQRGEDVAASLLEGSGLKVIERNYNQGKGEVDIIARGRGELVFVEVRSATTDYLDSPAQTVDARKQQLVIRGARAYLRRLGGCRDSVRFDVIAVTFHEEEARTEWFQDAFRPPPSATQNRFLW